MADAGRLKQVNMTLIREAMRGGGEHSKNELARRTGLSFPTVSRIVDDLVEAGEAKETGTAASTGGRCAKQYALDPAYRLFLCLRLEGRRLSWFVCDLNGTRLEQEEAESTNGILHDIDTLAMRVKARYPQLAAAAMGYDGPLQNGVAAGSVSHPELRGVSLQAHLEHSFGLPVAVERDMYLVSVGCCCRRKQAPKALVCVYLGRSGIGAGAAIGGKAFHGANGFAGELHYLPIKNNLEYAKSHFAGADMVAYYMQVIRAYAALLNPDRVVLYDDPLISGKVERIRNACAQTLPPQALPVIELSREFTQDYEAGLCALALGLVEERL